MCLTTLRLWETNRYVRLQPLLQVEQQVQRLRLDRDVERGNRFVGHDQPRVEGQGAGDADALPLAAAEGVREALHELGTQAHQPQQLRHAFFPLLAVPHPGHQQRLADDVEERHARVERPVGILEDHLHLRAQRLQLLPA